jgi:hypothetical protein
MSKTFSSVRALFAGKPLAAPAEDENENDAGANTGGKPAPSAGPTMAQVEEATATEVSNAVTAANVRWNTVMTSDAGAASPKAAARMLMAGGGSMAADEIVATLADLAPGAAASVEKKAGEKSAAELEADRLALAGDPEVNKKTGGAGGSAAQRRGEGDDGASATIKTNREKRAERANRGAEAKGGKRANG